MNTKLIIELTVPAMAAWITLVVVFSSITIKQNGECYVCSLYMNETFKP